MRGAFQCVLRKYGGQVFPSYSLLMGIILSRILRALFFYKKEDPFITFARREKDSGGPNDRIWARVRVINLIFRCRRVYILR